MTTIIMCFDACSNIFSTQKSRPTCTCKKFQKFKFDLKINYTRAVTLVRTLTFRQLIVLVLSLKIRLSTWPWHRSIFTQTNDSFQTILIYWVIKKLYNLFLTKINPPICIVNATKLLCSLYYYYYYHYHYHYCYRYYMYSAGKWLISSNKNRIITLT